MRTQKQHATYLDFGGVKIDIPAEDMEERRKPRAFYGSKTGLALEQFAATLFTTNELRVEQGFKPLTDEQLLGVIHNEFRTPDGLVPRVLLASLRNSYNHGKIRDLPRPTYMSIRYLKSGQAAAKGPSQKAIATGDDLLKRMKEYKLCDPRADRWGANLSAPYPENSTTGKTSKKSTPAVRKN